MTRTEQMTPAQCLLGEQAPHSDSLPPRAKPMHSCFAALIAAAVAIGLLFAAAPAQAEFGFERLDLTFTDASGQPSMQAGSHPFAQTSTVDPKTEVVPGLGTIPSGQARAITVELPPGFVGSPDATPRCATSRFSTAVAYLEGLLELPDCPDSSAVGLALARGSTGFDADYAELPAPVYNLIPPPGFAARLGFRVTLVGTVFIDIAVNQSPPYNLIASSTNITQRQKFRGVDLTLWSDPGAPAHDDDRGLCGAGFEAGPEVADGGDFLGITCPANIPAVPFFTLPRRCTGPLLTTFEMTSWLGDFAAQGIETHDAFAQPLGVGGCARLGFAPSISAAPSKRSASSPTGLDFALQVHDEGLMNVNGISHSDIRKAVVTLPEGFTANPSLAEGLAVCTEAQLGAETPFSAPGEGCPNASKIGSVEVETPLLQGKLLKGSLFVAEPYENEFGSLLALYIVIKHPELGILVTQAAEVIPDPQTGQLTTVAEGMPELPFSDFRLHFREGARSPLVTPPACGTHTVEAQLFPWSGGPPITSLSDFQIVSGPDNRPCPSGGLPPFRPGLSAGTLSNAAGRFSPFNLRLFRTDSEQEFTRFSIKLPPGIAGILAGIPKCPDAAIEAAKARTGAEELASPSCPVASQIGRSLAGAGVGPALTYAPGAIYLAGPYEGAPISIAAITAAKVGPFDVGTVVIRQGFKIDPRTAEVFLDPIGSDPIPHIIDGIVVHARDIRAYVDRPNFVFNPTSCEPTATASTLLGSGLDFASPADDNPVVVSSRFQAADCAALPFKPKFEFRLVGGTKRGAHPSFRAHVGMKGLGEANIAKARVTLPRSEFLENSHIGTICTRVQFAAETCPAASIYGTASATTPVLDQPLTGPIYLRSSENELPDLVAAFRSAEGIKFELVGRVDSVKGGGIRNTFEIVPDAPVTSADFTFFGQKKGLLVNSTDVCKGTHKVKVELTAHNGKRSNYATPLKARCAKKGKRAAGKPQQRRAAR